MQTRRVLQTVEREAPGESAEPLRCRYGNRHARAAVRVVSVCFLCDSDDVAAILRIVRDIYGLGFRARRPCGGQGIGLRQGHRNDAVVEVARARILNSESNLFAGLRSHTEQRIAFRFSRRRGRRALRMIPRD